MTELEDGEFVQSDHENSEEREQKMEEEPSQTPPRQCSPPRYELTPLRPPPIEPVLKTPGDYETLKKDAQVLISRGSDLQMNDKELRTAIKRAMRFEKSFEQFIDLKKQQFKILEECFEIETTQCRSLLDQCKEVLKEKHGVDTTEFENLLTDDQLKAKVTASPTTDLTKPPPSLRIPPPHAVMPTNFSTPPPPIYGQRHAFSQPRPASMRYPASLPHCHRIPPFITPPHSMMYGVRKRRMDTPSGWRSRSPPTRRF